MHKKIATHFKKNDPILFAYIDKIKLIHVSPSVDLFTDLCDTIISQQLSGKAAESIFKRFLALFPKQKITPEYLLKIPEQKIRDCGTSWAKVRSLKDLSQKVMDKTIHLNKLDKLSDDEVVIELIKVRGIGPWTAEMFLMFALGREDIFSHGDLGLRNALIKMYKLKKEPTKTQIEKITLKWRPYRSHASRILWKSLELS